MNSSENRPCRAPTSRISEPVRERSITSSTDSTSFRASTPSNDPQGIHQAPMPFHSPADCSKQSPRSNTGRASRVGRNGRTCRSVFTSPLQRLGWIDDSGPHKQPRKAARIVRLEPYSAAMRPSDFFRLLRNVPALQCEVSMRPPDRTSGSIRPGDRPTLAPFSRPGPSSGCAPGIQIHINTLVRGCA
jgi:hypothetical protein